jgi:hypothetical protein
MNQEKKKKDELRISSRRNTISHAETQRRREKIAEKNKTTSRKVTNLFFISAPLRLCARYCISSAPAYS